MDYILPTVNLTVILLYLIIFSLLVIGILVIYKNPRSTINRSFFVFLFGLGIVVLGFLALFKQYPYEVFDPLIHYGGLIFLIGLFIFSQIFPHEGKLPRQRWPLYIPFAATAIVIPFRLIIESASFDDRGRVIPDNGPLFLPYLVYWLVYILICGFFLLRTYRKVIGKERLQMQYLFIGILILLTCLFIFDLILPIIGITSFYLVGPLSAGLLIALTAYAILKHRLMDVRFVVQKGLAYTIVLTIFILLYTACLSLFSYLFQNATNLTSAVSAGITTILGIIGGPVLERYFRKWSDPFFFKDRYNYAAAVHELSHILYTSLNQRDIISQSQTLLQKIFKTADVQFMYLAGPLEDTKTKDEAGYHTLTIPITSNNAQVGFLHLGEKRSGDSYTTQDVQLVQTFIYQAAIALEKSRLYEQVQEYNTHLVQLVDDRTQEIKKIQEDQKQAMIDISHNLQTPLAVIKGELELLGESSDEPEKMLAVRKSLTRVSHFIRQLLHLARLDNSIYNISKTPIELSRLVKDQVEYFEVMAAEKKVRIVSDIMPGITILGERKLLQELLTNLVVNSIKYRKPRRPSVISISLSQTNTEGILSVTDNGIGIRADDIDEVFTRFYRVSREVSRASGTGLGLAIAKKIVEQHNGTISVKSIVGEETTFTIVFPKLVGNASAMHVLVDEDQ